MIRREARSKFTAPRDADVPASLHILGKLRITGQRLASGQRLEERHHVQALLALIGPSFSGVPRDELIDALWPSHGQAAGRSRLYHTLHLARKAVASVCWDENWVSLRSGRVVLDERVWCDARVLTAAASQPAAAYTFEQLNEISGLCENSWMPGLQLGSIGRTTRDAVHRAQLSVLRELVVRRMQQGDTPHVRGLLDRLMHLEATDEWAHRQLMTLDLAAERNHAVLRTFQRLCAELQQQLGLQPQENTRAIAAKAASALRAAPRQDQSGRSNAPGLVGREALAQSVSMQVQQRPGLWNLFGRSGIGKSVLALCIAQRVAPTMADGVCVVEFADRSGPFEADAVCARQMGLHSHAKVSDAELIRRALASRETLLILDDIDSVPSHRAFLEVIASHGGRGRIMVLSQASLGHPDSTNVPVPALSTVTPDEPLETATLSDSYTLFEMRCPDPAARFQSTEWRASAVRLVAWLEGQPLAIELAAARTDVLTPGEILAQLEHSLRPLEHLSPVTVDHHSSVRSSLQWSARLFSEEARLAYACASVFPSTFATAEWLALLTPFGLVDQDAAAAAIAEVVAAGFVGQTDSQSSLRMLHLPRVYARTIATESGLWPRLLDARMRQVAANLSSCVCSYESTDYSRQIRAIATHEESALAVLPRAREAAPASFVMMVSLLCDLWALQGFPVKALELGRSAIAIAAELGLVDEELLLRVRLTNMLAIDHRQDRTLFLNSIADLITRAKDRSLIARAIGIQAQVLADTGDKNVAAQYLLESIRKFDFRLEETAIYWIYARLNKLGRTVPGLSVDRVHLKKRFYGSMLWPLLLTSMKDEAIATCNVASLKDIGEGLLDCGRDFRANGYVVGGLGILVAAHLRNDDVEEALSALRRIIAISENAGWAGMAASALLWKAQIHRFSEDVAASAECVDRALGHLRMDEPSMSRRWSIAVLRAINLALEGQTSRAAQYLMEPSNQVFNKFDDEELIARAEVAAVLLRFFGNKALASALCIDLRHLDASNESIPIVARFRDKHLGVRDAVDTDPVSADDRWARLRNNLLNSDGVLQGLMVTA